MKYGLLILPMFYIISGILALNGIYIVKDAKDSAYFLIGLGSITFVFVAYALHKKRRKDNSFSLKNNSNSYFIIGVFLLIIVLYFILREFGIYFTNYLSLIIILLVIIAISIFKAKRIKNKR